MSYGDSCSHPSGYEQGNIGYSGTPMWKIKQQMEAARQRMPEAAKEVVEFDTVSNKSVRCLVDGVAMGDEQAQKPAAAAPAGHHLGGPGGGHPPTPTSARHVLVRDLRKAAQMMKIPLPRHGIFEDESGLVRCSLFAVFDGQQCAPATASGSKTAEFNCRNLPAKLLSNLSIIPAESCNHIFMKSALIKTFEDLEADSMRPVGAAERCAAAVALVLGDWVVTAVLGRCSAQLCQVEDNPSSPRVRREAIYSATELGPRRRGATGGSSLGDAGVPEVASHQIELPSDARQSPPLLVLASTAAADALPASELSGLAASFSSRPRAASGGIASTAVHRLRSKESPAPDCAAVVAFFLAGGGPAPAAVAATESAAAASGEKPAAKKAKLDTQALQSVRLRQILVRHRDAKHPMDPVKNKPVTRSRAEAEAILRRALREVLKDGDHKGDSMWAAKSTNLITNVIKETSECKSVLKGGSMCGDLGWLGKKELQALGREMEEAVRALRVGEWSDVLPSPQGVHLVLRIA